MMKDFTSREKLALKKILGTDSFIITRFRDRQMHTTTEKARPSDMAAAAARIHANAVEAMVAANAKAQKNAIEGYNGARG